MVIAIDLHPICRIRIAEIVCHRTSRRRGLQFNPISRVAVNSITRRRTTRRRIPIKHDPFVSIQIDRIVRYRLRSDCSRFDFYSVVTIAINCIVADRNRCPTKLNPVIRTTAIDCAPRDRPAATSAADVKPNDGTIRHRAA